MRRRSTNRARECLERDTIVGLGKLVVPGYRERLHWYQRQIAEALEGMLRFTRYRGRRGGWARVVVSMPPRHGKSLHGVELFPALVLGRYPDMKIMVGTSGAKLAKKSVTNTERYMSSDAYTSRYATRLGKVETLVHHDGGGKVEVEKTALMMRTLKRDSTGSKYVRGDGYYMAQGIGGSLTGEGFEIGILDDLIKNAEQALNPAWHAKAWDFYLSTFDTRGDHPWASQLYIGTRWTAPDFVDELIEHWHSESSESFPLPIKEIKLPAIAEAPLETYDPRELGEGLDKPSVRPVAWYEGKRQGLMSRRPWVWFGMYQQRPSLSGSKFFQPEEWLWYGASFQLAQRLLLVDFSIDAAMSEDGQSFFVINVYGYLSAAARASGDAGEHFFLLDERRGHWTIETLYTEFEYLWRKWSRALPRQFDEATIFDKCPELYDATRVPGDETKHHARPRIWCENKALGHSFNSRYKLGAVIAHVTTTLSDAELQAVGAALYPVPKLASKTYCYKTAGQVVSNGRVWLPQISFGNDPLNPHLPLVNAEPTGIVWEQDAAGVWHKHKADDYDGKWVHEQGNHPGAPDDRRDVLAQEIICRTPWLGAHLLGSR